MLWGCSYVSKRSFSYSNILSWAYLVLFSFSVYWPVIASWETYSVSRWLYFSYIYVNRNGQIYSCDHEKLGSRKLQNSNKYKFPYNNYVYVSQSLPFLFVDIWSFLQSFPSTSAIILWRNIKIMKHKTEAAFYFNVFKWVAFLLFSSRLSCRLAAIPKYNCQMTRVTI